MKQQINWRHGVLFCLMAFAFIAVAGETESHAAFFTLKASGLAALWALKHLTEKWQDEGKIENFKDEPL